MESKDINIKCEHGGKILFLAEANVEIQGGKICIIEKCKHDTVLFQVCTVCGVKVEDHKNEKVGFADIRLSYSETKTQELYKDLEQKLLDEKKLFLILDIDNTLVHTETIEKLTEETK